MPAAVSDQRGAAEGRLCLEILNMTMSALDRLAEIQRLATLPAMEYDPVRKAKAKQLGLRMNMLDAEVKKMRLQQGVERAGAKESPTWEPNQSLWAKPVAGDELLTDLIGAIRRYVMLDQAAALIVALWILFTWVFEHIAETNPYLRIVSPAPECGKSTLLKIIKLLARSGWLVSNHRKFIHSHDATRTPVATARRR